MVVSKKEKPFWGELNKAWSDKFGRQASSDNDVAEDCWGGFKATDKECKKCVLRIRCEAKYNRG